MAKDFNALISHQVIIRSICNPPSNPSICKSNKHYVLKKKTRKKHKQPNQCNRLLNQSPVAVLENNVYMPQPERDLLDIIHCASRFLSSCSWWFHCRIYSTFFPSHVSLSLLPIRSLLHVMPLLFATFQKCPEWLEVFICVGSPTRSTVCCSRACCV